ncbi:hypothetical protein ACPCK1_02680 [Streptomyces pseudogriseolus]|uniref:hypothetical protein n=1 Tax=Streptomyces pseudogriseolus TaxID=36817 RepID=UPI003FA2B276
MTREEQQAYVRRIVDAAPILSPADCDTLRRLVPLQSRLAGVARAARQQSTRRSAAA